MGLRMVALLCLAIAAHAQQSSPDENWVVVPAPRLLDYANTVPNSPSLVKSLGDAAEYLLRWRVPADAEAWKKRRPEVERSLRKAIGLEKLPARTPLNARVVGRQDFVDYTVENVIFESRPGFPVSANLYRPKAPAKGKRAAVLSPIGHYLGAGKTARDVQSRAIGLARMGFVVLTYDAIGQGERMFPGNIHHEAGYALLPLGETIAGWMVWDSMRAIDYLVSLPDVDGERIGVTGNSGGGLNTLFTAALDQRVRAAVIAGYTFEFNNWLKYGGTHCACTHLPGIFRAGEWFEIASLIAPRALLMMQGQNDGLFPISGARRAGHSVEAVYALTGERDRVRFLELPGQPHAYSRPFREPMYGWMARHLLGQASGEAIPEADTYPLPESDPRLLCDPQRNIFSRSPSVIELARKQALTAIGSLDIDQPPTAQWVRQLTAPPEEQPHYLAPRQSPATGGMPRKVTFTSEDGQYIPGLLWLPGMPAVPPKTVIVADDRGKKAVAQSGMVQALLDAGLAVFAVDLRGRGETLGWVTPNYNTSFRLTANQVMFGRPLAGRRAYDLIRAIDYLAAREWDAGQIVAVGVGNDVPAVLLAAAVDARIRGVAIGGYFHSFVSQMRPRHAAPSTLPARWNDPQISGGVDAGGYSVDFSAVIPYSLQTADIPDILAHIAPRRVLYCQTLDTKAPDADAVVSRFRRVTAKPGEGWIRYEPGRMLDGELLRDWIRSVNRTE
ncbi:MAG: acetylxylan esterase [Acidobacteria bacterium]|nr:acetylxylan esterase [Acidobacteriota bacterium]